MVINYPQFGIVESPEYLALRVKSTARELRKLAEQADELIFDPFAFARKIGIKIEIVPMVAGCSGRLRTDKGYALIELSESDVPTRQRFTMCHELAHICFWDASPIIKERGPTSFRDKKMMLEERLCDQIASELLMPTDMFLSRAKAVHPSFDGVRSLAKHFDVSKPVVVNKLTNTQGHGWYGASIRWTRSSSGSLMRDRVFRLEGCRNTRGERATRLRAVAHKAFTRAERVMASDGGILRQLTGRWVTLAMHYPEVTIWRDRTDKNSIHGKVFFSLTSSDHPQSNGS